MKVKELISDTIWIPGFSYDADVKPKLSVLLPTFRRGKSGLFKRAVESILSQTLDDIELIIIDDASTDGTADQIAEFQRRDGRISCLRHPKNIGLPAISEYEAYVRARADRISFAFDDTMFNDDALEKLLAESEKFPTAIVYGHVEWSHKDQKTGEIIDMRLGSARSQGHLRLGNFIPNNGVLMPRDMIEDIGFYDPHIVIARVCDWDLWCRAAERYEVRFVDVAVGREDGPMTSDSLGNTYALDSWAVDEWMRTSRNEALRPANIPEYEVLLPNPDHGISTQSVCDSLAQKHAQARGWKIPEWQPPKKSDDGYTLVVNLHYNASTTLYFDMLPAEVARRVRVISYHGGFGVEELARATSVIFVRHISAFRPWIEAAKALGIPTYFFLDDNLPMLVENKEVSVPGEDFRLPKLREDLKLFSGVLLSSANLLGYFKENKLHENLTVFPVSSFDQRALSVDFREHKAEGEIVIACAGGSHRNKGLWSIVFPALVSLAEQGARIHLVAPKPDDDERTDLDRLPTGMRVTLLPFETGYLFAMRRFARFSPDYVLHAPSETRNNRFKTQHALLTAKLLNAVAIVPNTPPFDNIEDGENAIVVNYPFASTSWLFGLKDVVSGKYDQQKIKEANSSYCEEHFSGKENARVIAEMQRRHGGEASWSEQARRLHRLPAWVRATTGFPTVEGGQSSLSLAQASELAGLRHMARYSWRLRVFRRRADLWGAVAPQFVPVKQFSDRMGWRNAGSSLELSDSLSSMPFREYRVAPRAGKLAAVSFVMSVDFVKQGLVGVEIVSPNNEIKDHVVLDLTKADLGKPVRFELTDIRVREGETWGIRVFARSAVPVYVFEFINRRVLGLRFVSPTPFMTLDIE
ncbi:Glycosyltransferase [Caballeronia glathei]|uniref:Glycosyltransferase 2-like domain-containing protein n=1 Tax=Caballeronia glathei TaxID=60547 RepID=A0A069PLL0_9BURK|nr:glycosyltransferase [Caballeronia glathei]KDR41578.1 hypothetical protein BG61_16605 [Caballeronia glathei]CDY79504.1 Glycosyltransferase [Caballeronia glathei]